MVAFRFLRATSMVFVDLESPASQHRISFVHWPTSEPTAAVHEIHTNCFNFFSRLSDHLPVCIDLLGTKCNESISHLCPYAYEELLLCKNPWRRTENKIRSSRAKHKKRFSSTICRTRRAKQRRKERKKERYEKIERKPTNGIQNTGCSYSFVCAYFIIITLERCFSRLRKLNEQQLHYGCNEDLIIRESNTETIGRHR